MLFPAASARAMLAGFRALDLDAESLRREAGLDEAVLARLDGAFSIDPFNRLWCAATRRAPREELPTEVGLAIPFGAFGALDYLAGSSPDVEAGFRALAQHMGQVSASFFVEVEQNEDRGGCIRLVPTVVHDSPDTADETCASARESRDLSDEFTLATCFGRFRSSAVGDFRVRAVRLTRPAPLAPTRHAELFGAEVTFGCAVSALEIDRASFKLPLRRADPALQETLRALAVHLELGPVGSDLEAAVRARLRILLPDGAPSAAAVARSVGLTERTLQRQLKEAGTSFTAVLDAFRQAEAERLVSSGLPLAEIALRLGFADQTTWNRAFKRWKGMSPTQWALARGPALSRRTPTS